MVLSSLFMGRLVFANDDVNEIAAEKAICGSVSVSSWTATNMSSATISNSVAYNICNEDADYNIRCGYDSNVSVTSGSGTQGFKIPPGDCRYRGVGRHVVIYCLTEKTTGSTYATREVFR